MANHITESPSSMDESQIKGEDHHHKKKRVGRACDSCRIKKTKCDGVKPCSRCVQDNKICVFSEKKKQKDKNHPSGYVELLETRLDLLTKSLETIILLAKPHLGFLSDLVKDNDSVPINNVVAYLINKQGLLRNLPVEWEKGALIAANLSIGKKDIEKASKTFAEHKLNLKDSDYEIKLTDLAPTQENDCSRTNSDEATLSLQNEFESISSPNSKSSLTEQLNLNDFSLGGYSSGGLVLANSAALNVSSTSPNFKDFAISDFESDTNSIYLQHHELKNESISPVDNFPINSNSLFLPNSNTLHSNEIINKSSSVTSLTNKFETHGIQSPTNLTPLNTAQQSQSQPGNPVRRSPSLSQRPLSPSYQKLKNNGHVFKPHHNHNHNHNHHSTSPKNIISNNGNEFHLSKKVATPISPSLPHTPLNDFPNLTDDFNSISSLPSYAFKLSNPNNFQALDILDTENLDNFIVNNPFTGKS